MNQSTVCPRARFRTSSQLPDSAAADDAQQIDNAIANSRTVKQLCCRFGREKKFISFQTVIFILGGERIQEVKGSSGRVFVIILNFRWFFRILPLEFLAP
jgi:hypothetical protein